MCLFKVTRKHTYMCTYTCTTKQKTTRKVRKLRDRYVIIKI